MRKRQSQRESNAVSKETRENEVKSKRGRVALAWDRMKTTDPLDREIKEVRKNTEGVYLSQTIC